jgi:uncharacterized protein (TIGR02466 family)
MAEVRTVFVTKIYRASLKDSGFPLDEAEAACRSLAEDDGAGIAWCRKNAYPGYTSYASLNDLPWRFPVFKRLARILDGHAAAFARLVDFDLGGEKLKIDDLWVNVLEPGGVHTAHVHPRAVLSGTAYVAIPPGASAIKFEDPRLGFMMAAPPRKEKGAEDQRPFVYEEPQPGTLLMWESWLRHEVPLNRSGGERISVSFNYRWR